MWSYGGRVLLLSIRSARSRALSGAAALFLVLTSRSSASAAARTDVGIGTATYQPSLVTVAAVGDRVRWTNHTSPSRVHDVVSSLPDYFHMPLGGSGSTYKFTFRAAGYFNTSARSTTPPIIHAPADYESEAGPRFSRLARPGRSDPRSDAVRSSFQRCS